jgi:ABC-2 type transport system ATP-binding protein
VIGYLPGELRLDERMSVAETLRSWERLRGTAVDRTYVDELCDRLDLDQTRETRGLSSGNRRKVGLVGAFMSRPELLILDEPTGGVDPLVQAEFLALVAEARDRGATVFLSSHVLSEVQRAADHVVVIRAGQIVATGSVDEVRHAARQPFVATFVDAPPIGELEATSGVGEVRVRGREVNEVIKGSPNPLLAVLAKHPLEHLLLPEPDLEDAFLRFYQAERLP